MARPKSDRMTEQNMKWETMLCALRDEYLLSIKDICKELQASRSWVNQYVLPFCRTLYIGTGYSTNTISVPWTKIVSRILKKEISSSIWVNVSDYIKLLEQSIVSVDRQTRVVPFETLVEDEFQFRKEYDPMMKKLEAAAVQKNWESYLEISKTAEGVLVKHTTKPGKVLIAKSQKVTPNKNRSSIPWTPVELNAIDYRYLWRSPHELKDYGDTDEIIYRKIFKEGQIRIKLCFHSQQGREGKRVYYIPDPFPIQAASQESVDHILAAECDYQEYLAAITRR